MTYDIREFGTGVGAGSETADTDAVTTMLSSLQTASIYRGGEVRWPAVGQRYKVARNINHEASQNSGDAHYLMHCIQHVGDGVASAIDFAGCTGTDKGGFTYNRGGHGGVKNLWLINAKEESVYAGKDGGGCFDMDFGGLRLQASGGPALRITSGYGITAQGIYAHTPVGNGIQVDGFNTSLNLRRLAVTGAGGVGHYYSGMTYSECAVLSADSGNQQGYFWINQTGVAVKGIGAERNKKDACIVYAASAYDTGVPTANRDIHGLTFEGVGFYENSYTNSNTYASLFGIVSENGRNIDMKVTGLKGTPNGATDRPNIICTTGGIIRLTRENWDTSAFTAADYQVISGGGKIYDKDLDRKVSQMLAAKTWDPPSVANGATTTTTCTVTGALAGDVVEASFDKNLQGLQPFYYWSAADTITYGLRNNTGAAVDLASGTLKVKASRYI